ncbi:hypothetical protein B0H15DRAFT_744749, partial [Mycena belliarum]
YGGGFTGGGSANCNASTMPLEPNSAQGTPIIYVSLNYWLGPLGVPQGEEASQRGILNLGLYDQPACLEFRIQLFIGGFGGDHFTVTVVGRNSGSVMTSL